MSGVTDQVSGAELANMPPEAIVKARREGKLRELLAGRDPGRREEQGFKPPEGIDQGARGKRSSYSSERAWLRDLSPDQIVELRKAGSLDGILGG
jgi:hypothetical protein